MVFFVSVSYDLGQFRWISATTGVLGPPRLEGSANFLKGSVISEPRGRRGPKIVNFLAPPEWPQASRFDMIWDSFGGIQIQFFGASQA